MRFIYNFTLKTLFNTTYKEKKNMKVTNKGEIFKLPGKVLCFLVGTARTSLLIWNRRQGVLFFLAHLILFKRTNRTNVCYNNRILCKLICVFKLLKVWLVKSWERDTKYKIQQSCLKWTLA